jgi:hypothetical protein
MATPAMMKTEPSLANPYSQHQQHLHHLSTRSAASPRIKQEGLPTTTTPATMPEPVPFGLVTATNPTTPSTPYLDNYHRMQMRLPTPCSDSDPGSAMQVFLRHSPPPAATDFLHNQHHNHSHHHALVGAGSPPLSTTASSPYDFSQCCDTVVTTPAAAAGSPIPWHSQHLHHHPHGHGHHHSHSQATGASLFPTFDIGISTTGSTVPGAGGYTLDAAGYNTTTINTTTPTTTAANNSNNNNPFCHHHPHTHHRLEEDGHHEVDALGLHIGGGGSMFRERELEMMEMGGHGMVKADHAHSHSQWEADVYEI